MRPTRANSIEGLQEKVRQNLERGEVDRKREARREYQRERYRRLKDPNSPSRGSYARGQNPESHTQTGGRYKREQNLIPNHYKFPKGNCANPGGRPKNDIAAKIARAIFENNEEKLYTAYGKQALKGNAYAFQVLADRAYGKLKERHEYDLTPYRNESEQSIYTRIAEIESRLGYSGTPRLAGGTEPTPPRAGPQILPPED